MPARISLLGALGVALVLISLSGMRTTPPAIREFDRAAPGSRRIALTFDAGGEADSFQHLLRALADGNVRCTFFVTGRWAQEHRDFVRQLARDGHEIGNHTWNHPDLVQLPNSSITQEIIRTDDLLTELLGRKPARLFRSPYGSSNARVRASIAALGFQPVYWSLDSLDSVGVKKSPSFLFERIALRKDADLDGAIVLMHVGEPSTAMVLPHLIETLKKRDFRCVTVSQMIGSSD